MSVEENEVELWNVIEYALHEKRDLTTDEQQYFDKLFHIFDKDNRIWILSIFNSKKKGGGRFHY